MSAMRVLANCLEKIQQKKLQIFLNFLGNFFVEFSLNNSKPVAVVVHIASEYLFGFLLLCFGLC